MIRHEEGRAPYRHGLVAMRAMRVHLTARDPLEVRERALAVRTRSERRVCHGGISFRSPRRAHVGRNGKSRCGAVNGLIDECIGLVVATQGVPRAPSDEWGAYVKSF